MIITLSCFIIASSCESHIEEDYDEIVSLGCDPSTSFINQIKPIIDSNCLGCHNGSQFPDLRTYNSISNNSEIIKEQVINRTMPIGGALTNEEIELISCWIDNGTQNN